MKIILISGKKRSGKDFFANLLKEKLNQHGKTCDIFHFADGIKDILSVTFNITNQELNHYKDLESEIYVNTENGQKSILNFRKLLQRFGTEAMQTFFGKDVWKNQVLKKIENSKCDYVLIPDFRFLHENITNATTILILGGKTVDNHISENQLQNFKFDYIINNKDQNFYYLDQATDDLIFKLGC